MQLSSSPASPLQNNQFILQGSGYRPNFASISAISHQPFTPDSLRRALGKLSERLEILRTTYHKDEQGVLWQQVQDAAIISVENRDWSSLDDALLAMQKSKLRLPHSTDSAWIHCRLAHLKAGKSWIQLVLPAINCDGFTLTWLMQQILTEQWQSLPDTLIQYSDVSHWLNDFLIDDDLADARAYWQPEIYNKGMQSHFGLSRYIQTEQQHAEINNIESKSMGHILPLGDLLPLLQAKAADCGVKVADLIYSSLRLAIQSISGDMQLTRVVDSRREEALAEVAGPMSRAIPLYSGQANSLEQAVAADQQAITDAEDYIECFSHYLDEPVKSFAATYQALNYAASGIQNHYLEALDHATEKSKLQFIWLEQGEHSRLITHHDSKFMTGSTINAFIQRWHEQLRIDLNVAADTETVTKTIQEAATQGATKAHQQQYGNVISWFEQQSSHSQSLITDAQVQVSIATINTKANQLAHFLSTSGVQAQDIVALHLPRSIPFIIAMLAVTKIRAAYMPIDTELPEARVANMLADANPALVITQSTFEAINFDDFEQHNPAITIDADDTAYVLYTSGSTGKPKGLMVSHAGLLNHMAWMQEEFAFTPQDVLLQRTSVSFDASVWEWWAPLLAGANLYIAPNEANYSMALMADILLQQQITVLQLVPAQLAILLEQSPRLNHCALRYLFCGGEALPSHLARQAKQDFDTEVINVYGPSECTIQCVYWRFDENLLLPNVPIGLPIDNMRYQVLLSEHQSHTHPFAQPGQEGELLIAGPGVFKGYLGQPELTEQALFKSGQNTDSDHSEPVWYRTGDIVRIQHDGNISFLERIDHQIKINGFRIELEEISRLAEQNHSVSQAVCIFDQTTGNLILFVKNEASFSTIESSTADPSKDQSKAEAIQAFLADNLPYYMIPSLIIEIDAFTYLSNGKIDRNALLAQAQKQLLESYQAPETALQLELVHIWQTALEHEHSNDHPIGINNDFFQIGGHSLLAMKVVALINARLNENLSEECHIQLGLRDIFENKTIAELAEFIEAQQNSNSTRSHKQLTAFDKENGAETEEFEL